MKCVFGLRILRVRSCSTARASNERGQLAAGLSLSPTAFNPLGSTCCYRSGGLVVEKLYRAIFHAPSEPFLKMNSSWFASALFAPVALTVAVPAELVRANAQSGAT